MPYRKCGTAARRVAHLHDGARVAFYRVTRMVAHRKQRHGATIQMVRARRAAPHRMSPPQFNCALQPEAALCYYVGRARNSHLSHALPRTAARRQEPRTPRASDQRASPDAHEVSASTTRGADVRAVALPPRIRYSCSYRLYNCSGECLYTFVKRQPSTVQLGYSAGR